METGAGLLRRIDEAGGFEGLRRSFARATGLPVRVVEVSGKEVSAEAGKLGSGLCGLLAGAAGGCELCGQMRQQLGRSAAEGGTGLGECPAGLQEAMIPLRAEGKVVGYLQTGQVMLRAPSEEGFRRLRRWLSRRDVEVDEVALRKAYFASKVVGRAEYRAMLELFVYGVEALSERVRTLLQTPERPLSPPVARAMAFVEANAHEAVSLLEVSRAAGLSRHHFCAVFRKETGRTLTEHVTLVRIERAAERLRQPGARVSEIAHGVGFQSLSQFNRSFRKVMGRAPSDWRRDSF